MNNPFSQPKILYKIQFITNYKSIEILENFFPEDVLGINTYEVNSTTIDSKDDDLWSFEIFIDYKPDLFILRKDLINYSNKHGAFIASDITSESIEDKDWVTEYQKQLKPIEIGQFIITSTEQKTTCAKGKTLIFIEASRAFGTGHHATTSLCIEAMEALKTNDIRTIFDVGTGSGILSFAGEKIWSEAKILACDIEKNSVNLAKDNLIVNNSKIEFYQNIENDLKLPNDWNQKFDLIVSNILAAPLIGMAESFRKFSHKNTRIILSGFLDYQKEIIENAYNSEGFIVENFSCKDKWIVLTLLINGS